MYRVNHLIGGEAVDTSCEESAIFNPSTSRQIGTVLHGGVAEVDSAVAAAGAAFKTWSQTGLQYRADLMLKVRELLVQRQAELVDLVMTEAGKTRDDAAAEVGKGLEILAYTAGIGTWYGTGLTRNIASGVDTYDARYPIGVIAAVSPFNFPVMIPVIQSAMAIACGNTVVVKPSEKVPSAFRLIADIFLIAGLPKGVLNVVNGGRIVVERFTEHPDIAGVTFVGSTAVAKKVRVAGVMNDKRVQAFGGGKNHMIVLPDADLDVAADAAVSAAYGAAGQRCMAISVVVAVGGIGDQLVAKIKSRISSIVVGSVHDDDVQLGPVISQESMSKINAFISVAEQEGAFLAVDGRELNRTCDGWLVGASLVDHVRPGMSIYENEVFGPVLSVVRAETFDEAMNVANQHSMGNGAAIFTRDGAAARQYVDGIEAGMVGVNIPIPVPAFMHSFGGWKDSAFTETKLFGPQSLTFLTRMKAVVTRWPDPAKSSVNLGFLQNKS
jgi:malonate-semialdehyde dehydrogenase (acetylating)/methylmalonate-semialdehyde dehydrogenase